MKTPLKYLKKKKIDYIKNRKTILEYKKQFYLLHKEKILKKQRNYYLKNKNEIQKRKNRLRKLNLKIRYYNSPWLRSYDSIKRRVNNSSIKNYKNKGIKNFLTEEKIQYLWFRDKAYLLKEPSIDRIDNDRNYILENCRFIEKNENLHKGLLYRWRK